MDNSKKDIENLEQIISMGDDWLRRYGIVSPFAHNSIVLNLRMKYDFVKNLEYDLDPEERKLNLTLYLSRGRLFWMTLTRKRDALIDDVIIFLNDYLHQYDITVQLLPYKKESK